MFLYESEKYTNLDPKKGDMLKEIFFSFAIYNVHVYEKKMFHNKMYIDKLYFQSKITITLETNCVEVKDT